MGHLGLCSALLVQSKGTWRYYSPAVNEALQTLPLSFGHLRKLKFRKKGKDSPKDTEQMKPKQLGQNQASDFHPFLPKMPEST